MNQFVLANCTTESGALAQLGQQADKGAVVKAGGIDLLDLMKNGVVAPPRLVNIRNISGMRGIREIDKGETPQGMHIGALTTLAEISEHPLIRSRYTIFADEPATAESLLVFSLG